MVFNSYYKIITSILFKISIAFFSFKPALTATAIISSFVGSILSLIEVVRKPFMPSLGKRSNAGAKCQSPSR